MLKLYEEAAQAEPAEPPDGPPSRLDGLILIACGVAGPVAAAFLLGCFAGLVVVGFRWVAG